MFCSCPICWRWAGSFILWSMPSMEGWSSSCFIGGTYVVLGTRIIFRTQLQCLCSCTILESMAIHPNPKNPKPQLQNNSLKPSRRIFPQDELVCPPISNQPSILQMKPKLNWNNVNRLALLCCPLYIQTYLLLFYSAEQRIDGFMLRKHIKPQFCGL